MAKTLKEKILEEKAKIKDIPNGTWRDKIEQSLEDIYSRLEELEAK